MTCPHDDWTHHVHNSETPSQSEPCSHSASNWQPIDTAPKDGSSVLLYWPANARYRASTAIGHWVDKQEMAYGKEISRSQFWTRPHPFFYGLDPEDDPKPSHWMPLPAPPQGSEP